MGFINEKSNSPAWLRYLNPTMGRVFVQPLVTNSLTRFSTANWRVYTSNANSTRLEAHGSQFGRSFAGARVESADAWRAAVAEVRAVSAAPGAPDFLAWLEARPEIGWAKLLAYLHTTMVGASMAQVGNPAHALARLRAGGYQTMAVWDVRCRNLRFTSTNPAAAEYWRERWEMYRLFYVGGRWLAANEVTNVELYNEPDKDLDCIDAPRWADDLRIRSQALQDGYADHNARTGARLVPFLIAPTGASSWTATFS
jgi:hypothetical protein